MKEIKFIQKTFGLTLSNPKVLIAFSMLFILFSSIVSANPKLDQDRIISGIVTDNDGIPLEGVTVLINQFERGTATDTNGKYSISAKRGDKILFSYVGFTNKEFIIDNKNTIDVTMEYDVSLLDEIVLVGYGKKERSKVSAAISTIKGKDIKNEIQSGNSFDRSLSGLVQGVRVIQGGGKPGSGVDINIRGYTSPFVGSANNPLFVIDGVPIQAKKNFATNTNPLASMNPNDIESINVLKDAAATSIYGSRGANGVIIIKTKKGALDKEMTVQLSLNSTFSRPIKTLNYLGTNDYKNYVNTLATNTVNRINSLTPNSEEWKDALSSVGAFLDFGVGLKVDFSNPTSPKIVITHDPSNAKFGNANTNWADVVYRNAAYTQEYNASLQGGTEKTAYGISLRYLDQEGLLKADNFKQYNARLNFSVSPNEKWKIGTNVGLSSTNNKTGYVSLNQDINNLLTARPDLPVYNEKGEINAYKNSLFTYISNPLGITTKHRGQTNGQSVTGNVFVNYEILKGLTLNGAVNLAHYNTGINNYMAGDYGELGFEPTRLPESRSLTIATSSSTSVVTDFNATYKRTFNNKHSLDALAGYSTTRDYFKGIRNRYAGFTNNDLSFPQFAPITFTPEPNASPNSGLNSYMARASYDYDNKYGITGTIRLDQATNYPEHNRNAWFPSVSASWNIHNEKFIVNKDNINTLRLRLSYGTTGSTNVPSFSFIQKFTPGEKYNGKTTLGPRGLSNDNIRWEKTVEINTGLDFGFFNNKFSGNIDFYKRKSSDVLANIPFPLGTGATSVIGNLADIENKGFEIGVNIDILRTENLNWSFGANATKNINTVLSFNKNSVSEFFNDSYEKGKEINLIRGYVVEGIYKNQKEIDNLNKIAKEKGKTSYDIDVLPGDYKMKDINGDGTITSADRKILGSSQPDIFGGFRTKLNYKGFSLAAAFSYSIGSEVVRKPSAIGDASPNLNIETKFAPKNRWSAKNENAKLPRIGLDAYQNDRTSTANVFDTSYLRFKNIRFGYDLPNSLLETLKLSSINLYLSANNIYTWTDYPGLDPESTSGGALNTSVLGNDFYPISKSLTFGVNVTF